MMASKNGKPGSVIPPPFGGSGPPQQTLNGDGADLSPRLESLLQEYVSNQEYSRAELFKRLFDSRRNIDDECGFPRDSELTAEKYHELYARDPIAARVVEVYPRETWSTQPLIYEDDDPETVTPFEEAWDNVGRILRGERSGYRSEAANPVWEYLARVDVLSGIGRYGVILLGLDDGLDPILPAEGVEEENSMGRGKGGSGGGDDQTDSEGFRAGTEARYGTYNLVVNAEKTKGRKLLYLRVFPESMAQITRWEMNPTSPRYGMPVAYHLSLTDPRDVGGSGGGGTPLSTREVHWTRVIHVADLHHTGSASEFLAVPRMRPVLNNLLSLQKVYGADGEGYWKACISILALETHPQLGGDVRTNDDKLRDRMENLMNGLQRYGIFKGMSLKSVGPTLTDPTPHVAIQIEAICVKLACPVPVFKGYEIGEQASTNNDSDWNERVQERRNSYVIPRVLIPFADRLVLVGVLPEPGEDGYRCEWPDKGTQSEEEKATVALTKTQALAAYVGGGVEAMLPPREYLTAILGMDDEEADAILTAASAAQEDQATGDSDTGSPLLKLVGGITGMIELFKLASTGGLSEEQLKQQMMLFFGLSSERADALIADGLTPTAEEAGGGMETELEAESAKIDEGLAVDPVQAHEDQMKMKAQIKSAKPNPFVRNTFCPTGPGGGVDPSCSSGDPQKTGVLSRLPQSLDEARALATAAREHVIGEGTCAVDGDCMNAADQLGSIHPQIERWHGNYRGEAGHDIVKAGNYFIDITADQFGGPEIFVFTQSDLEGGKHGADKYWGFQPAKKDRPWGATRPNTGLVQTLAEYEGSDGMLGIANNRRTVTLAGVLRVVEMATGVPAMNAYRPPSEPPSYTPTVPDPDGAN